MGERLSLRLARMTRLGHCRIAAIATRKATICDGHHTAQRPLILKVYDALRGEQERLSLKAVLKPSHR